MNIHYTIVINRMKGYQRLHMERKLRKLLKEKGKKKKEGKKTQTALDNTI